MPEARPAETGKQEVQKIVRLAETNIDGVGSVEDSLRKVRGISVMLSNAIALKSGFMGRPIGSLSDKELARLEAMVVRPQDHGIPSWMLNRRRDPSTGESFHLVASGLDLAQKNDINEMKKLKSYKGIRHIHGLPVRGQRTRGSFRKGKTVGVSRKSGAAAAKK
jgi:small subunit ribosomal protein S13